MTNVDAAMVTMIDASGEPPAGYGFGRRWQICHPHRSKPVASQ